MRLRRRFVRAGEFIRFSSTGTGTCSVRCLGLCRTIYDRVSIINGRVTVTMGPSFGVSRGAGVGG